MKPSLQLSDTKVIRLVLRVQSGSATRSEEEDLAWWILEYIQSSLFLLCKKYELDVRDTEDCPEEVFARIWPKIKNRGFHFQDGMTTLEQILPLGSDYRIPRLRVYLRTAVQNAINDFLRQRKHQPVAVAVYAPDGYNGDDDAFSLEDILSNPSPDPLNNLIDREDSKALALVLNTAIGKLREIDQIIIRLSMEGLDYPQVAEILGKKAEYVAVTRHRAKEKLKKVLEKQRKQDPSVDQLLSEFLSRWLDK